MIEVTQTPEFAAWLGDLADERAKARIAGRIQRMALGNPGDVKPVGEGVSELRIDYGPGYRVYFKRLGDGRLLLTGGTKATQAADIRKAKELAK